MKIFEELEGLVSGKIGVIKTIAAIFKLEARLAGYTLAPLFLNLVMLLVVLITIWLSTMILMGHLFALFFDSTSGAILFIWGINVSLLIVLCRYMKFNLNNMSFEKTREYFSSKENEMYENDKKRIN